VAIGFSRRRSRIVTQRAAQSTRTPRARSNSRHIGRCRKERVLLRERSEIIDGGDGPTWVEATRLDWRAVDRALRDIALRRAKLDAEEARWLREAERLQIWRPLGMVSALDYLERVLGHTPHVANERLRVARALGELPVLTDSFARGDLQYSAIRELTRVATPATEIRWRDAALGKNVRQVEELVAGHRRGEDPHGSPPLDRWA